MFHVSIDFITIMGQLNEKTTKLRNFVKTIKTTIYIVRDFGYCIKSKNVEEMCCFKVEIRIGFDILPSSELYVSGCRKIVK